MKTDLATGRASAPEAAAGTRMALAAVLIGTFVGTLSNNLVNVPLHSMLRDFDAPLSDGIFVVVGFVSTFAVSMPLVGWIGERFGLRLVYCLALAGTAACTVGAALAPSLPVLIAWRALAGFAAAAFAPVVMALIAWMFGPARRAAAISAWAAVNGVGQAVGPSAGGVIDGWLSWRWALGGLAPICVVGILATVRYVPVHRGVRQKFDLAGAATFTLGAAALMMSVLLLARETIPWPVLIGVGAVGVVLLVACVMMSSGREHAFVPVRLMRNRVYVLNSAAGFAQMYTLAAILVLIPLYLTAIAGRSTAEAGFVLLALPVTMVVFASVVVGVIARFGLSTTLVVGLMVLALSAILLSLVLAHAGDNLGLMVAALVVSGIGVAFVQTPASTGVTQTEAGRGGSGLGIFNLIRFSGSALGAGSVAIMSRITEIGASTLIGALVVLGVSLAVVLAALRAGRARPAAQWSAARS